MRIELGRLQVEVQQCALSSEVGEELGQELAKQQWTWKWRQIEVVEEEEDAEEDAEEEEEENNSDKIQHPSPGRWGTNMILWDVHQPK